MRIDFDRIKLTASVDGMVCRGEASVYEILRVLTDSGRGNGPASFWDERGMRCMTVGNIAAAARLYRPNEAEKAARRKAVEA